MNLSQNCHPERPDLSAVKGKGVEGSAVVFAGFSPKQPTNQALQSISFYNSVMSPNAQRLLDEARQLSPEERDWLAECLLIKDENVSAEEVDAAWGEEIKRRLDEIDSGAVKMIPGDEVLARMDARLKARRRQAARRE